MLVYRDDSQVKDEEIYDVFTVELNKKPGKGLGLSIVGRRNDVGVYISDIVSILGNMYSKHPVASRICLHSEMFNLIFVLFLLVYFSYS